VGNAVGGATNGGRNVRGGYGVANETVVGVLREAEAHERDDSRVSTGPCTSG